MCKSRADGGQRCATHTRPEYLKTLAPAEQDRELTFEEKILLGAASISYATTIKGAKAILEDIAKFNELGKMEVAAILRIAMLEGQKQREQIKEAEMLIYCDREGYNLATILLVKSGQEGLNRWEAYQKVCEAAANMKEEIQKEIMEEVGVPQIIRQQRLFVADKVTKVMVAVALDYYAQSATTEDIGVALSERESSQREAGIIEDTFIIPDDLSELDEQD